MTEEAGRIFTPLEFAKLGYYIFPCQGKKPWPGVKWKDESTRDPATIEYWIENCPDCNWGCDCGKTGLFVVDLDSGKNPLAADSLKRLEDKYGPLPKTFTVRSISGGFHYYFYGMGRNSAGTSFGPGIDTKSVSGYVVAPCGGGYSCVYESAPADAPQWMLDLAGEPTIKAADTSTPVIPLDGDSGILLATAYVKSAPAAIQGADGEPLTFRIAARVKDFGVSQPVALELMLEHWSPRCQPPWDADELERKIANAYGYGSNPPGVANPEAVFTEYIDPAPSSIFTDLNIMLNGDFTIDYLVDGLIETPSTGLMFGSPSAGKSFQAGSLALSVATGTDWMGHKVKQGIVVMFMGEGRQGLKRRAEAWKRHHGIRPDDNSIWISNRRVEFTAASLKGAAEELKKIEEVTGKKVVLVIVDTLARHMPTASDENSAKDMGGFINACDWIRDQFNCVALIVHHSGKGAKDNSRGSSALRGAMDWEIMVEGLPSRSLIWTKQKEGELPPPLGFTLIDVQITDEVKSAVPVSTVYDPSHGKMTGGMKERAKAALECLRFLLSMSEEGKVTRDEWRDDYYATFDPKINPNTKRSEFNRAVIELTESKTVRVAKGFYYDNALSAVESV